MDSQYARNLIFLSFALYLSSNTDTLVACTFFLLMHVTSLGCYVVCFVRVVSIFIQSYESGHLY